MMGKIIWADNWFEIGYKYDWKNIYPWLLVFNDFKWVLSLLKYSRVSGHTACQWTAQTYLGQTGWSWAPPISTGCYPCQPRGT